MEQEQIKKEIEQEKNIIYDKKDDNENDPLDEFMKDFEENNKIVKQVENFDDGKKNNTINSEESESPILPNRSFSYNIQNILMKFYLLKLSYEESDFTTYFKKTNLYFNYKNTNKYQNNSGKILIENINETKNNQRSIENCFTVEYNN